MKKWWLNKYSIFGMLNPMNFISYIEGEGGGGEAPAALPEGFDIGSVSGDAWASIMNGDDRFKESPVALNTKDPLDAVDQLVNANKLLGQDRLPAPKDDWEDEQWGSLYNTLGRPEAADGYSFTPPEGMEIDKDSMEGASAELHKLGLSDKQHAGTMSLYFKWLEDSGTQAGEAQTLAFEEANTAMKKEYGDAYDGKVEQANAVIGEFGGEEAAEFISKSGFGNNPAFIKMMMNISEQFGDDSAIGQSLNNNLSPQNGALREIAELKTDEAFKKRLFNEGEVGHKEAVQKWHDLHKKAYPNKKS